MYLVCFNEKEKDRKQNLSRKYRHGPTKIFFLVNQQKAIE